MVKNSGEIDWQLNAVERTALLFGTNFVFLFKKKWKSF